MVDSTDELYLLEMPPQLTAFQAMRLTGDGEGKQMILAVATGNNHNILIGRGGAQPHYLH